MNLNWAIDEYVAYLVKWFEWPYEGNDIDVLKVDWLVVKTHVDYKLNNGLSFKDMNKVIDK